MKDEVNDIKAIMTKHFAGEATPTEEKVLSTWINQSGANSDEYEKSKKLFDAATRHYKKSVVPDIDVDAEWKIFERKVAETKPVIQLSPTFSFMRIAAAFLLVLVSGFIVYYFANKTQVVSFETLATLKTVQLPDGSTVILNRYSSLEYTDDFGDKNRNINLKGEAFFEVRKNATLPFIIAARNTTIEVVGTSFNVLAYDSLTEVEVVVKTGVVRFSVPTLKKVVELTAGEKGIFESSQQTLQEKANEDVNYQSWNTHTLTFTETHLSSVIEAINKTYHSNIVLTGSVSDACLLTASFDNQSLEAVLNVLEFTLNLTYQRVGNQIEITSAGC